MDDRVENQLANDSSASTLNVWKYSGIKYPPHFHNSYELGYVTKGEIRMWRYREVFTVRKGEFFLIAPLEPHSFEVPLNSEVCVTVFSESYIHYYFKNTGGKIGDTPVFSCSDDVRTFFENHLVFAVGQIFDVRKSNATVAFLMMIKSVLYAVVSEYSRTSHPIESRKSGISISMRVISYISDRFREDISLTSMAEELGYSKQYISRVLNASIGFNFKEIVNQYRLENVFELLRTTDISRTDAAFESGFQSMRSFNRVYSAYKKKSVVNFFQQDPPELRPEAISEP